MNRIKILNHIKDNIWIILTSIFFIGWKFFLINIFLKNPLIPDAYVYIEHIDSINRCSYLVFCKEFLLSFNGYFGFEHLFYRLFFGFIGHLLQLDSLYVFYLSFYLGALLLIPCLIFFLSKIEKDKNLIAFSLFFLALFNGTGSYHGFYWVVPSFYSVALVLIIFGIIIGKYKHWKIILTFLIPIALYIHTIALYLILILIPFFFIYSFLTHKFHPILAKKIIFSIFILFVAYFIVSVHINGNPYGIVRIMNQETIPIGQVALQASQLQKIFPGFGQITTDYFNFIFLNPIFILLFIYVIIVLLYYKQHTILSFYFSSLSLTLLSTVNYNAIRSLILTWPFTFILYSYGVWFSFKLNRDLIKNKKINMLIDIGLILAIIFFILISLFYSYFINKGVSVSIRAFLNI